MARSSRLAQCSVIMPSRVRNQWVWVMANAFPAGGMAASTVWHGGVHGGGARLVGDEVAGVAPGHGHVEDHQVTVLGGLVDLKAQTGERGAQPLGGGIEPGRPGLAGGGRLDGCLAVDRLRVEHALEVLTAAGGHEAHAVGAQRGRPAVGAGGHDVSPLPGPAHLIGLSPNKL